MRSALGEIYEDGVAIGEKRGEERGITIGKEYGISSMLELLQELGYCEDEQNFIWKISISCQNMRRTDT